MTPLLQWLGKDGNVWENEDHIRILCKREAFYTQPVLNDPPGLMPGLTAGDGEGHVLLLHPVSSG